MSYNSKQNGAANYNSWMHLTSGQLSGISEGPDNENFKTRRYAQLVYQVNKTPINVTGTVEVDTIGIDETGTVKVSGDQLKVFDQESINLLNNVYTELQVANIEATYSRVIQEVGTDTYMAHAPAGTSISASGWRAQKIDNDGNRQWASSGQFNQPAITLSALTYNY